MNKNSSFISHQSINYNSCSSSLSLSAPDRINLVGYDVINVLCCNHQKNKNNWKCSR